MDLSECSWNLTQMEDCVTNSYNTGDEVPTEKPVYWSKMVTIFLITMPCSFVGAFMNIKALHTVWKLKTWRRCNIFIVKLLLCCTVGCCVLGPLEVMATILQLLNINTPALCGLTQIVHQLITYSVNVCAIMIAWQRKQQASIGFKRICPTQAWKIVLACSWVLILPLLIMEVVTDNQNPQTASVFYQQCSFVMTTSNDDTNKLKVSQFTLFMQYFKFITTLTLFMGISFLYTGAVYSVWHKMKKIGPKSEITKTSSFLSRKDHNISKNGINGKQNCRSVDLFTSTIGSTSITNNKKQSSSQILKHDNHKTQVNVTGIDSGNDPCTSRSSSQNLKHDNHKTQVNVTGIDSGNDPCTGRSSFQDLKHDNHKTKVNVTGIDSGNDPCTSRSSFQDLKHDHQKTKVTDSCEEQKPCPESLPLSYIKNGQSSVELELGKDGKQKVHGDTHLRTLQGERHNDTKSEDVQIKEPSQHTMEKHCDINTVIGNTGKLVLINNTRQNNDCVNENVHISQVLKSTALIPVGLLDSLNGHTGCSFQQVNNKGGQRLNPICLPSVREFDSYNKDSLARNKPRKLLRTWSMSSCKTSKSLEGSWKQKRKHRKKNQSRKRAMTNAGIYSGAHYQDSKQSDNKVYCILTQPIEYRSPLYNAVDQSEYTQGSYCSTNISELSDSKEASPSGSTSIHPMSFDNRLPIDKGNSPPFNADDLRYRLSDFYFDYDHLPGTPESAENLNTKYFHTGYNYNNVDKKQAMCMRNVHELKYLQEYMSPQTGQQMRKVRSLEDFHKKSCDLPPLDYTRYSPPSTDYKRHKNRKRHTKFKEVSTQTDSPDVITRAPRKQQETTVCPAIKVTRPSLPDTSKLSNTSNMNSSKTSKHQTESNKNYRKGVKSPAQSTVSNVSISSHKKLDRPTPQKTILQRSLLIIFSIAFNFLPNSILAIASISSSMSETTINLFYPLFHGLQYVYILLCPAIYVFTNKKVQNLLTN